MLRVQMSRQLPRSRMIKDERGRQHRPLARRLLQLIPQLDRAERVEPGLHQRRVRVNRAARRATYDFQNFIET